MHFCFLSPLSSVKKKSDVLYRIIDVVDIYFFFFFLPLFAAEEDGVQDDVYIRYNIQTPCRTEIKQQDNAYDKKN